MWPVYMRGRMCEGGWKGKGKKGREGESFAPLTGCSRYSEPEGLP